MLAAFVAGAVLGIVANSVPTAAPKSVTVLLIRLRAELLRRERNASWVREVVA